MKVLHLIPTYIPTRFASGPINASHHLNKWLVKSGIEVTVYTTNADRPNDEINVPVNMPVDIDGVRVFYCKTSFPRKWYYSSDFHKKVRENIKGFDLVHITSVFLAPSTLGAYYAKKFKKPYIISSYGSFMKFPMTRHFLRKNIYINLIEKKNLIGASAIHFSSEKEREEYEAMGLPAKRESVIFSAIDSESFGATPDKEKAFREKLNIPENKKIILFLGRLNRIKGFDTLIPAFREVIKQYPDVVLVLAGYDEGYGRQIARLISENKVADRIIIPGPLFDDEKRVALSGSDIFVLPSYSEAGSIAVIEALYCGLPVIITENCGMSSEIANAGAGIIVGKTIEELSGALIKILNNHALAEEIGQKAKAFASNELVFDRVVDRYKKLYSEVVMDYNKTNRDVL